VLIAVIEAHHEVARDLHHIGELLPLETVFVRFFELVFVINLPKVETILEYQDYFLLTPFDLHHLNQFFF